MYLAPHLMAHQALQSRDTSLLMAAVALPGNPQTFSAVSCDTIYCDNASSLAGDEDLVSRTSSHLGVTPDSMTLTPGPRRKSSFRAKPGQSHMADQNGAVSRKTVHFGDPFEQTRLFQPVDAPLALTSRPGATVGAATTGPTCASPFQLGHERSFCLLNSTLSAPPTWQPIRLESLALLPSGHEIRGTVAVLNIAFRKEVSARFTFDDWHTVSDIAAEHRQSLHMRDLVVADLFSFTIDKRNLPLATGSILHVCVRYKVLDQEYWDNNGGMNYEVALVI